MKKRNVYTLGYRRRREGKTNYKDRLKILSSGKLRVVVRRSLRNILVQIVKYEKGSDKVLVSASSRELLKYGCKSYNNNLPSAYLLGILCGLKAKKKGFDSGILDLGLNRVVKNSVFFAVAKGLKEAGFNLPLGENVLPSDDRVNGKHIEDYAKFLANTERYKKQFSGYIKSGFKPEYMIKHVKEVKDKINSKWQ